MHNLYVINVLVMPYLHITTVLNTLLMYDGTTSTVSTVCNTAYDNGNRFVFTDSRP